MQKQRVSPGVLLHAQACSTAVGGGLTGGGGGGVPPGKFLKLVGVKRVYRILERSLENLKRASTRFTKYSKYPVCSVLYAYTSSISATLTGTDSPCKHEIIACPYLPAKDSSSDYFLHHAACKTTCVSGVLRSVGESVCSALYYVVSNTRFTPRN